MRESLLSLNELEKKSAQIIREAFERFSNLGSCLSGGNGSLLMTKLILGIVRENGYEQPIFSLCDPIPFKENKNFNFN